MTKGINWLLCDKLLSRLWHLLWRTKNNLIVLHAVKSSAVKTGNDQTLLLPPQECGVDKNKPDFLTQGTEKCFVPTFTQIEKTIKKQLNMHRKKKKGNNIV